MNRDPLATKRLGGNLSPGRLRALSSAVLLGRNEWTTQGDTASYRLTARTAELAIVAELLSLPTEQQEEFVAWLVDESAASLLDVIGGSKR